MPALSENPWVINLLQVGVPFLAYFVGIIVRKVALSRPNAPSLRSQMLLGVPMSLVIVSPVLTVLGDAIHNLSAYLLTVGVIMEQGMVVTEMAAKQLQNLVQQSSASIPVASRSN